MRSLSEIVEEVLDQKRYEIEDAVNTALEEKISEILDANTEDKARSAVDNIDVEQAIELAIKQKIDSITD